jgi:hypothetical protein
MRWIAAASLRQQEFEVQLCGGNLQWPSSAPSGFPLRPTSAPAWLGWLESGVQRACAGFGRRAWRAAAGEIMTAHWQQSSMRSKNSGCMCFLDVYLDFEG